MDSYFKNWFKNYGRSKRQPLSNIFAVYISGNKNKLEIEFREPYGKKILFILNEKDSSSFIGQIDRVKSKIIKDEEGRTV